MNVWLPEINDLKKVFTFIQGKFPDLEKELDRLIKSSDENMILVYARRGLEVIVTDLCENELKRQRGTEPLQRIIDKLNKEQIVPANIIVSMLSVNSMSAFGAHPKEYDIRQVKPVLSNLSAVIDWYLSFRQIEGTEISEKKVNKHAEIIQETFESNRIDSIAILPFDNFTGNDSLEYFVAGMHSSLISDMGQISGLRVIGKTSSNVYKNTDKSIPDIASELNVGAIMESEVLSLGDNICVQIKLIRTYPEEKPLWHGTFNEDKSRILNLYNNVTKKIAEEVKVQLTPEEEKRLNDSNEVDREAYDAYLRSHQYWDDLGKESLYKAMKFLDAAIEKDKDWASPYAALAQVWAGLAQMGYETPEIAVPKIYENLNRAIELDPDFPNSFFVKGVIAVWSEWNWEKGEQELLKAIALNPNDAMSRMYYSHLLAILQREDEALSQVQLAIDLDPLNSLIQGLSAAVYLCVGNVNQAMERIEKSLELEPTNGFTLGLMEMVAYRAGKYDRVMESIKLLIPFDESVKNKIEKIFNEQGFELAYKEALNHMEVLAESGFPGPADLAMKYVLVNRNDKALEWLEKAFDAHDPNLPYLTTRLYYNEELYQDPCYISLAEKMGLPLKDSKKTVVQI